MKKESNDVSCWGDNSFGQLNILEKWVGDISSAAGETLQENATELSETSAENTTDSTEKSVQEESGASPDSSDNVTEAVAPDLESTDQEKSPVTFTSVAAGGASTCAISANGSLYCWGDDRFAQVCPSIT